MNTTKLLLLSLFIIGIFPIQQVKSQSLSPEEVQRTIDSLYSSDESVLSWAAGTIKDDSIYQALPTLETRFWYTPAELKFIFLDALAYLRSTKIDSFANGIIDSAGVYVRNQITIYDSLEMRAEATAFLLKNGNYSKYSYIFSILERDSSRTNISALTVLPIIYDHVPGFADSVIQEFKHISRKGSTIARKFALNSLFDFKGLEASDAISDCATNDSDPDIRWLSLRFLCKLRSIGLEASILDRIQNDPEHKVAVALTDSLLKIFGSPFDYNFIKERFNNEPDSYLKKLFSFQLKFFIPPKLDLSYTLSSQIDSLIVLKHQCASYGWVGDSVFVEELDSILSAAKTYIEHADPLNASRTLRNFQQQVDSAYNDSLPHNNRTVTPEGWKFLHYRAGYIIADLPVPPSQFMLNVNVGENGSVIKDPDQSLYDSASTVEITATPDSGYIFSGWSGDTSGTTNPITVTMDGNKTITASFSGQQFTILTTSMPGGRIFDASVPGYTPPELSFASFPPSPVGMPSWTLRRSIPIKSFYEPFIL